MQFVLRLLASTFAVIITAYLMPGVHVEDFMTAVIVAAAIGFINAFVRPLFVLVTLPLTIFSLGLFLLVINALMIELAAYAVDGFVVDGFWYALLYSLVLSIFNTWFNGLNTSDKSEDY